LPFRSISSNNNNKKVNDSYTPTSSPKAPKSVDMDDLDFDYAGESERLVREDVYYWRSILKPEPYLFSNISLGYAARCMPSLEFVWFHFSLNSDKSLEFVRKEKTGEATLKWMGENGHQPDERVARLGNLI
jgi:hypothetical protein